MLLRTGEANVKIHGQKIVGMIVDRVRMQRDSTVEQPQSRQCIASFARPQADAETALLDYFPIHSAISSTTDSATWLSF